MSDVKIDTTIVRCCWCDSCHVYIGDSTANRDVLVEIAKRHRAVMKHGVWLEAVGAVGGFVAPRAYDPGLSDDRHEEVIRGGLPTEDGYPYA